MFAMLGLSKIQLAVTGAIVVGAAVAIGLLMWQNSSLREDNRVLSENNGKLTVAVEEQKAAVEAAVANAGEWQAALEDLQQTHEELQNVERQASAEVARLQGIFARHDLRALAIARPGLIENRINSGTADALSVLERITSGDLHEAGGAGSAP